MDKIIQKTKNFVKEALAGDSTGHDWWHTERVYNMAVFLAQKEKADCFIAELAALLHDIDDWKFNQNAEKTGTKKARDWLSSLKLDVTTANHICQIIDEMSFKGAKTQKNLMSSLEGKIVQDADRLDAIGAIGIARTFAYGGFKGRPLHDPTLPVVLHTTFETYKNHQGTTLNHFYEKLLLLKDLMNTTTAKQIAQERHIFMEAFIKQFLDEWNAKL